MHLYLKIILRIIIEVKFNNVYILLENVSNNFKINNNFKIIYFINTFHLNINKDYYLTSRILFLLTYYCKLNKDCIV